MCVCVCVCVTVCLPYLLIGLIAQPLHQKVGAEGVGRTLEQSVDGGGVGTLHLCQCLGRQTYRSTHVRERGENEGQKRGGRREDGGGWRVEGG